MEAAAARAGRRTTRASTLRPMRPARRPQGRARRRGADDEHSENTDETIMLRTDFAKRLCEASLWRDAVSSGDAGRRPKKHQHTGSTGAGGGRKRKNRGTA